MALVTHLAALLSLVPALSAQTGGAVEGRILNSATGAGVGGVKIRLLDSQRTVLTAVTDDTGVFRIGRLKDGQYVISYERDGYLRTRSGPEEIQLRVSGSDPTRFDVEMTTYPSLRGRVLDAEGKPAVGIHVQAGPGVDVVTDADGAYNFPKLTPGRYTLVARPNPRPRSDPNPAQNEERIETVPTFYPSVVDSAQAEALLVRGGQDLSGYEIRLRSIPVQRIRGTVLNLAGKPATKAVVTLVSPPPAPPFLIRGSISMLGLQTAPFVEDATVTSADGRFEFASVRRGDWQIRVQAGPEYEPVRNRSIPHYGSSAVSVGRRDVEDLTIRLAEPFALGVSVDWGQAPERTIFRSMLQLIPLDGQSGGGVVIGQVQGADTFPGRAIPVVPVSVPGYYPAAVMLGGRDMQGQEVNLTGPQPIQVIYKSDGGTVRGTIDKGGDLTVVLVPQESSPLKMGISARADARGAYSIADVPPGDYYAVAIADLNGITTPAFQNFLAANGTRVRIEPSSAISLDLRPVSWP